MTLVPAVVALTVAARPAAAATPPPSNFPGYWEVASDGGVYQFDTSNYGQLRGIALTKPIVGGAATTDGLGYWLVGSDGGIFSFGDAKFSGSTGGIALYKPIVDMSADPIDPSGYWMVASDGGVFAFGGAGFYGSTGGVHLNKPIVGMAATPDGKGYWLVASDGGIFAFGDAGFYGSTGGLVLNKPVVGMAATPDGKGYWMTASDGGIFAFGDAGFYGSTGGIALAQPVIGIGTTPDGKGYWEAAADGGIFNYGDAPMLGTSGAPPGSPPIVALLATPHGYPFPPGATGFDVSQFQCSSYDPSGQLPPSHPGVAIVQATGGTFTRPQSVGCYQSEAKWAGAGLSDYIFMNPMVSGYVGPGCSTAACNWYSYGAYWTNQAVAFARSQNTNPSLWWLDVETGAGWNTSPAAQYDNSQEIAGAVAALRATGVTAGIYSTNLQWGEITGYDVSFSYVIPLWMAGASTLAQAPSFCGNGSYNPPGGTSGGPGTYYDAFAGGKIVLVQAGDQSTQWGNQDEDYACI